MKSSIALLLLASCTSLGPMPSTTGVSAIPAGRPGGEIQGALAPIFRLSEAARGTDPDADRNGHSVLQLAGLFEPDRLLGIPGLIAGARVFGEDGDVGVEPMIGYRHRVGSRLALAGVAFGTKMGDDENGASYDALRLGGEVAVDVLAVELGTTAALHVQGAVTSTYISATGTYCVQDNGNARDCDQDVMIPMVDGELDGLYTAGSVSVSLDVGRGPKGTFHSARLGGTFAVGHMPRLIDGRQAAGDVYLTGGVSLTLGFGAAE